jgi:hypothetical protein
VKQILIYPTDGQMNVVIDGESHVKNMTSYELIELAHRITATAKQMMWYEQWNNRKELGYDE